MHPTTQSSRRAVRCLARPPRLARWTPYTVCVFQAKPKRSTITARVYDTRSLCLFPSQRSAVARDWLAAAISPCLDRGNAPRRRRRAVNDGSAARSDYPPPWALVLAREWLAASERASGACSEPFFFFRTAVGNPVCPSLAIIFVAESPRSITSRWTAADAMRAIPSQSSTTNVPRDHARDHTVTRVT